MFHIYLKFMDEFHKWPNLVTSGHLGFDHNTREGGHDIVKLFIILDIEEPLKT